MELTNLKQPPFSTTLLGVIRGAADTGALLSQEYADIGGLMIKAADKEMKMPEKIALLREAEALESECVEELSNLSSRL